MNDRIRSDLNASQTTKESLSRAADKLSQMTPSSERKAATLANPHHWASPSRRGKVRPAILLWALGVPIPLVIIFLLLRSCS